MPRRRKDGWWHMEVEVPMEEQRSIVKARYVHGGAAEFPGPCWKCPTCKEHFNGSRMICKCGNWYLDRNKIAYRRIKEEES